MKLPPVKNNTLTLVGGQKYEATATTILPGKGKVTVTGAGRPLIDGSALQKFGAIWRLEKKSDWTLPPIDYTVPKSRFAMQVIGGALKCEGDTGTGDRRSRIRGGGYLCNAQQAERLYMRNYLYEDAPEEYVIFAGDPMQLVNPSWNMHGECRRMELDNIVALAHATGKPSQREARLRFMMAYGTIKRCKTDVTANTDPTPGSWAHKQAEQYRGTRIVGEGNEFAGSIAIGPLNPKDQSSGYQKIAHLIPSAWFHLKNYKGVGYVANERQSSALLTGWRITGIEPRAPKRADCFSAGSGSVTVVVGCEVEGFSKFSSGNVVVGPACFHKGKPVPVNKGWEKLATTIMTEAAKPAD